jgi:putative membrane protein
VKENGIWKTQIDIVFRSGMAFRAPEREERAGVPRRSFFFLGGSRAPKQIPDEASPIVPVPAPVPEPVPRARERPMWPRGYGARVRERERERERERIGFPVAPSLGWSKIAAMGSFLAHWLVTAISLVVADWALDGVHVGSGLSLAVAAFVLGLVNALVRPLILLLTLPLTVVTLGLFYLVVNGLAFALAAALVPGFTVASFGRRWRGR